MEPGNSKNHIISFLDFVFASYVPDLEMKKLVMKKYRWATDKIHPKKSLLPVAKEADKRQLNKTKLIYSNHSSQTPQKKTVALPPPMPQRPSGELRLLPL